MVRFWDKQIDRAIKITKMRIKHHEIHGNGINAMQEKTQLLKQEKYKKDRLAKLK